MILSFAFDDHLFAGYKEKLQGLQTKLLMETEFEKLALPDAEVEQELSELDEQIVGYKAGLRVVSALRAKLM